MNYRSHKSAFYFHWGMKTMTCTFFGHKDTPSGIKPILGEVLLDLIEHQGINRFYVGNQGNFDAMALGLLKEFEKPYSLTYDVVLAYLPKKTDPFFEAYNTILPEGIELVPRRFAIDYRNKWLIEHSDMVITYVERPFGGAAKFKALAEKKGKKVVELSHSAYWSNRT